MSEAWAQVMRLVDAPNVTEIHFEGPYDCSVRTSGTLRSVDDCKFRDEDDLVAWCNNMLDLCGTSQRIGEGTYVAEASYSSPNTIGRLHIVAPPLSPVVVVTFAKRPRATYSLEQLVDSGMMSPDMEDLLRVMVAGRLNFVVSGGNGSGKTTLVNALIGLVGDDERIGVIEEVPELVLPQKHVVHLYSRAVRRGVRSVPLDVLGGLLLQWAAEEESKSSLGERSRDLRSLVEYLGRRASAAHLTEALDQVTLGDLTRESLRMRFDRIVIGEVRGPEVVDLLGAMNSGFSGSCATIHANSAMDTPSRIQVLAGSHPAHFSPHYIHSLISQSLDIIVHLGAPEAGQHRVTEILAISNQVVSESVITTEPLFAWVPGSGFERVGSLPRHLRQKLADRGLLSAI